MIAKPVFALFSTLAGVLISLGTVGAPAYFTNADLARLLNWMLLNFSAPQVPADFRPYSAVEVAPLRQQPLVNVSQVRSELLERIAQQEQQVQLSQADAR